MKTRKTADALGWTAYRRPPFSKNLMQRRFASYVREDTMARIVGVPEERYSLWECGYATPPQEYVRRIASALRINPAVLGPTRRRRAVDSAFFPNRGRWVSRPYPIQKG